MDVFNYRRSMKTKHELLALAENRFMNTPGYNCAQTVLTCMTDCFNMEDDMYRNITASFGGGLSGIRVSVCGAVSGGLMFIGVMEKGNCDIIGQELIEYVKMKYGNINCEKILDIDFSNQQQVEAEKGIKKNNICMPVINDVCGWLYDRYAQEGK